MCFVMYDKDGESIDVYNRYWKKPCNVTINSRAQKTHKISSMVLAKNGYDVKPELENIIKTFELFKKKNIPVVAHNVAFDNRLLSQTCTHHQISWPFEKQDFFCTMKNARYHVNAKDVNGNSKAPSNTELYRFCKGKDPDRDLLHDALVDCQVTSIGFLYGKQHGWW